MTDADPPVDDVAALAVATALRASSAATARIVDDHEEYFEEILSTVLLAEIGRWYSASLASAADPQNPDAWRAALALEQLFLEHDEGVETVIVTGFLEALPHPDDVDRPVVESLPPVLREELRKMEDWRPE